ncbi:hypothetical protein E4U37_000637 [Claviceps purpurea]|nr:hypothetical protein E4U37_000637 [Claviceps purpurea]
MDARTKLELRHTDSSSPRVADVAGELHEWRCADKEIGKAMLRFGVAGGRNLQVPRQACFSKSTLFETDHIFDAASFIFDFKSSEARLENMVLAFGAAVVAAAVWSIWGTEMFPPPPDPKGDPETWTREEMRRWLAAVGPFSIFPFQLADY